MLCRNLQFIMLYLAGVILLTHNFVPHHHHKSSVSEHSLSHKQKTHVHEHSHDHESDESSEEQSPAKHPFGHNYHQETGNKFIIKHGFNCLTGLSFFYAIPEYVKPQVPVVFELAQLPGKRDKRVLKLPSHYSCFSLRGPPLIAIS